MPIASRKKLKCTRCGHIEWRVIGDALPDRAMLRPCPKCGGMMTLAGSDDDESEASTGLLGKLSDEIGKLLGS